MQRIVIVMVIVSSVDILLSIIYYKSMLYSFPYFYVIGETKRATTHWFLFGFAKVYHGTTTQLLDYKLNIALNMLSSIGISKKLSSSNRIYHIILLRVYWQHTSSVIRPHIFTGMDLIVIKTISTLTLHPSFHYHLQAYVSSTFI